MILLSGAGFQDRDQSLYGHQPFKVLADYMTRRGIAVLRVDDRGVGGSTGDVQSATPETFASDALAGVGYLRTLKDIDSRKIGLVGHSEGALVGAIAASRSSDIAFVVMLAGLGIPWFENNQLAQAEGLRRLGKGDAEIAAALRLNELIFDVVGKGRSSEEIEKTLQRTIADWRESLSGVAREEVDRFTRANPGHWDWLADQCAEPPYRWYLAADPSHYIERITCPVLALCGERDVQVIAKVNLAAIGTALSEGGNANHQVRELEGLNHLFQHCQSGLREEYAKIQETFSPEAMALIGDWITKRVE